MTARRRPARRTGEWRMPEQPSTVLLSAEHLTRHFKIGGMTSRRTLHAVDDVNFSIRQREIVALAGESGSGKSTIARLLARLYEPTAGEVSYEGKPLSQLRSRRDKLRYSGQVPMVFQTRSGRSTRCSGSRTG